MDMKNYRTTISGIITALAGFISYYPEGFGVKESLIVKLAVYTTCGGLISLGINASDAANKTPPAGGKNTK